MGRKEKELNKNGPFQVRFRTLCYQSGKTQEVLAELFNVSRPTLAGWLIGNGTPSISVLTKIARHFDVSTDYLLGLSDTASPDVSVSAAVKYTGLSEKAIYRLHHNLDKRTYNGVVLRKEQEKKKKELHIVSSLIQSNAFYSLINNLNRLVDETYLEKTLSIMIDRYFENDVPVVNPKFNFANDAERNVAVDALIHVLGTMKTQKGFPSLDEVSTMNDSDLLRVASRALLGVQETKELYQFYAAKAFNGYIDELMEESYKKAEKRFKTNKRKRD